MYIDNRDWGLYNQRLVNRGRIVTIFLKENVLNWKGELDRMNRGKRGSPYEYPNTIIWIGFGIKCIFHLGYRQLQGFMEDVCAFLNFSIPDFRTFWWRVNSMEKQGIRFNPIPKNRRINIAIDSTGLKLVNDGEYRTKKYKKIKNWAKFHAAIHEGTQEALNIIITKDNVGDCREFGSLLDPFADILNKVDADGAYDTNNAFEYCKEHGIYPGIPVKSNASLKRLGARRDAIGEQFGVPKRFGRPPNWVRRLSYEYKKNKQDEWRKNTNHGDRWGVEGFYSRFKRQFGEYVFSRKPGNVEKEIIAKTNLLNFYITS